MITSNLVPCHHKIQSLLRVRTIQHKVGVPSLKHWTTQVKDHSQVLIKYFTKYFGMFGVMNLTLHLHEDRLNEMVSNRMVEDKARILCQGDCVGEKGRDYYKWIGGIRQWE